MQRKSLWPALLLAILNLSPSLAASAATPPSTLVAWGQIAIPFVEPNVRYASIAAGGRHSVARTTSGTVVAWGWNQYGQGQTPFYLSDVVAVAAGGRHGLALLGPWGGVFAWGEDDHGQSSVPPTATMDVKAIAAGSSHSLALKLDGTVVAWGSNNAGEGSVPDGLTNVRAIAAGGGHNLALLIDGSVVAWGRNEEEQCTVPAGLNEVVAIAAGRLHSLALKRDGSVVAWGAYLDFWTQELLPMTVPADLPPVGNIASGCWAQHNVAVTRDGRVVAWGDNDSGQCLAPANLQDVVSVAAGESHSLALKSDGTVIAWGQNVFCQCLVPPVRDVVAIDSLIDVSGPTLLLKSDGTLLVWGDNTFGQCDVPASVFNVAAVAAGAGHSLALRRDGTVVAWGDTSYVPAGLSGVVAIAAGGMHNLALKNGGAVVAWGDNTLGQCTVPTTLGGVVAIAAGGQHSLALKADGTVVAWGRNFDGETTVPASLKGVVAVAAGNCHSLALKSDGIVVAWGANGEGQCRVPTGREVVAIAAAGDNSMALKNDGTVVAWGANYYGQCHIPIDLDRGVAIDNGCNTSFALRYAVAGAGEPSTPLTLSHVRASQRPNSQLCDIWYALSGGLAWWQTTVAVSTNGGITCDLTALHLSGPGFGSQAEPSQEQQIVWDAGADLPNFASTQMRIRLTVFSLGGTAVASSPIFSLDTRAPRGAVSGRVLANGAPVEGAWIEFEGTSLLEETDATGRFGFSDVPAKSGYVVIVCAEGCEPKRLTGVNVPQGTTDLGDILLTVIDLSGLSYHVVPLVPDVNPANTVIEQTGVGYRYYRVLTPDESTPVGGVTVRVQFTGGREISQAGDESGIWAGRRAGVSDANGIVRLRVPASEFADVGVLHALQVLQAGEVKQTFFAGVTFRRRQHVWRNSAKGDVGVSVEFVGLGASAENTVELRHGLVGTAVNSEYMRGAKFLTGRLGVEAGPPYGLRIQGTYGENQGTAGAGAGAGAYGGCGINLWTTYRFSPASTDPVENAFKLGVVTLGSDVGTTILAALLEFSSYENQTRSLLEASGADLVQFVSGQASADLGVAILSLNGEASLELRGILGMGMGFQQVEPREEYPPLFYEGGVWAAGSASLGGSVLFDPVPLVETARKIEGRARVVLDPFPSRVEVRQRVVLPAGATLHLLSGWDRYDRDSYVSANCPREFKERVKFKLGTGSWSTLSSSAPAWLGISQGSVNSPVQPAAQYASLLNVAWGDGAPLVYEKATLAGEEFTMALSIDAAFVIVIGPVIIPVGLGVEGEGVALRGGEVVNERGKIWNFTRMALESYPSISANEFPTETLNDLAASWAPYAKDLLMDFFSVAEDFVEDIGDTVIETVEEGIDALLDIPEDALDTADKVWSWATSDDDDDDSPKAARQAKANSPLFGDGPLPPPDTRNYRYGFSGVFGYACSNTLRKPALLSIGYTDAQAAGLPEAELRIYQRLWGTNRWQLVGGQVDTLSNRVTAPITNLGIFTLAPPLPAGDLRITPSIPTLRADGTSQMTLLVTNLLLNTGASATQAWLFTAQSIGLAILNTDLNTNLAGVQIVSSNAELTLQLRAPLGGTYATVRLRSVAGDAAGCLGIDLADDVVPAAPENVTVAAGQSRIAVSWQTNSEPDVVAYRVFYRTGAAGPPWDGTASVEGNPSPLQVTGTKALLRGLIEGTAYYVAVCAVDEAGNAGPLSSPVSATLGSAPPAPPTGVAVRFGEDGNNLLMWALSEDDGYNDRDVVRYEVWRALLPGGSFTKVGEMPAGRVLFRDASASPPSGQYWRYAISAVDQSGSNSVLALANRVLSAGEGLDNDGDDMADDWEARYGLSAENPVDALADADGDGLSNRQEFRLGRDPTVADRLRFSTAVLVSPGMFGVSIEEVLGRSVTLQASTNLADWFAVTNFPAGNQTISFSDVTTPNIQRFYRAVVP